MAKNSASWLGEDSMEATASPSDVSVSELTEEVPALTAATIVGVTVVIIVGIAVIFLLGILIDWRQQKLLNEKMGEARRLKNKRRVNINTHPEDDNTSIANNMEESGMSLPPAVVAEALRSIP